MEPARGSRLPCNGRVHHDFNLSNILMHNGAVTGVVDSHDAGRGSRVLDFATLLFESDRLREAGGKVARGGSVRLVEQILTAEGDAGMRLVVTYGAIARLALTIQRGQFAERAAGRRPIADLLEARDGGRRRSCGRSSAASAVD